MKRLLTVITICLAALFFVQTADAENAIGRIRERGRLLWGTDAEGGAPYAFPDPRNPARLIGFEIDLAEAIGRELGVPVAYVQNAWDSLIPALERGDFDVAVNGIEITAERRKRVLFSRPYYVYSVQLVVRADDSRINGMTDLKGMRVGTLQGAVSQAILEKTDGAITQVYAGVVEPYEDLALGRIDAVFLDTPIAAYYGKPNPKLRYAGSPVGEGLYGIAIRTGDDALRREIDSILGKLLASGELKSMYQKWGLWDRAQERLFEADTFSGATVADAAKAASVLSFVPALLKGAGITILVSTVAMAIAVVLGLAIVLARLYGPSPLRAAAAAYVEFFRGTPLLIQLYILYYGLPNIGIALGPLAAAFIGLGMNYAAYEAELYRAGIEAVPKGQTEAALSLGMTRGLALRRIVLPQAFRIALPGVTNDFIALFKDSSLVSIIAMVELTKTYSMLAATTLKFFELGLITAFLYFAMSYPLSLLARRLERRLQGERP